MTNNNLISKIRNLARTGRHAEAVERAGVALARPDLPPEKRLDLLDLRAGSYSALGEFDQAGKDARAMLRLANAQGAPGLISQALIRKSNAQQQVGDLQAAVRTAGRALKAARNSGQKRRIAAGHLMLGWAINRIRDNLAPALEHARQAIALFQEQGEALGEAHGNLLLASVFANLKREEDSRSAARKALVLYRRVGDHNGIAGALNTLSHNETDTAQQLEYLKHSLQAYEKAGNLGGQVTGMMNLALLYTGMGLYFRAVRLGTEAVAVARRMGAKVSLVYALNILTYAEREAGFFEDERRHVQEYRDLSLQVGMPLHQAGAEGRMGLLELDQGNHKKALKYLKSGLKIAREAPEENIFHAALGLVHLAAGAPAAALKATTRAVELHRALKFARSEIITPQGIWWRHVRALNENGKTDQAREALDRAYDFLLESIANIRDIGLRRNTLNKVADNRELLRFWVKDGRSRNAPSGRLYAYRNLETSLREPFKRLAETSLRLNALKAAGEIYTFLVEEATELIGGERVLLVLEKDEELAVVASLVPRGESPEKALSAAKRYISPVRTSRLAQLTLPRRAGRSRIVAPMVAQNQLLGYLYTDIDTLYGKFDETDRDMLGMLANQGAVALENAGLLAGLERKVEERTEALNARVEELSIINSVQEGLASELDMQAIYDLVGDKIRQVFEVQTVNLVTYNHLTDMLFGVYVFENGVRFDVSGNSLPAYGFRKHVIQTRKSMLINKDMDRLAKKFKNPTYVGADSKSAIFTPLIAGREVIGVISLQNTDREDAFTDSDVRLLETLASSMSVALQNAQSFKAEQERVAELQVINTIQEGLSAELDFQTIVDLVGDKLREVFQSDNLGILTYDDKNDLLVLLYEFYGGKRHFPPAWKPRSKKAVEYVGMNRQPIIWHTRAEAEKWGIWSRDGQVSSSGMFVPVLGKDKVVAAIRIVDPKSEYAFDESDLRLVSTVGNSMGVALENARLFDETQRLVEAEQQRVAELQIINAIQQGLASKLEIQAIIDLVGRKVGEIFKAMFVYIALYHRRSDQIEYPFVFDFQKGESFPQEPAPLGGGASAYMIRNKQPLMINEDFDERMAQLGSRPFSGGEFEARALLGAPLMVGDEAVGTVVLLRRQAEGAFSSQTCGCCRPSAAP